MIAAVVATIGLVLAALVAAFALTWRRWAAEPVRVERAVEGPTCYPQVKR